MVTEVRAALHVGPGECLLSVCTVVMARRVKYMLCIYSQPSLFVNSLFFKFTYLLKLIYKPQINTPSIFTVILRRAQRSETFVT